MLYYKKLSDLVKTLAYFYQIPYPKSDRVWTKLDNILINKIFVPILIVFFCIGPYVMKSRLGDHFREIFWVELNPKVYRVWRVNPYTRILHIISRNINIIWTCNTTMERQFCQLSYSVWFLQLTSLLKGRNMFTRNSS